MHKLHNLDRSKQTHLAVFEVILKEMGISGYTFWVGRESKKLKWRTLTGPVKLVVFHNLRNAEGNKIKKFENWIVYFISEKESDADAV